MRRLFSCADDNLASFTQFAKVMALGDFPEAIYKLGDAYARARVVEKDLRPPPFDSLLPMG